MLFLLFLPFQVMASTDTVKSPSSDTVYYLDETGSRHAFPNRTTYDSWFGGDFSQVKILTEEELADLPLGKNVVVRPGKYLLKVPSRPEVYAVEPGGALRELENRAVAETIFGPGWETKIRDLPEVFFENYTIGEQISFAHQAPDGTVLELLLPGPPSAAISQTDNQLGKYFWKNKGVIEPFADWSAVLDNGYDRADVVVTDVDWFRKQKPITGKSSQVFNLDLGGNHSTATCDTSELAAAIVFVTRDDELAKKETDILQATAYNLPESWRLAANDLSKLRVKTSVTVVRDKDGLLTTKGENGKTVLNFEELGLQFYENEKDEYDFLIVYNDFLPAKTAKEQASYLMVRNDFQGTNRIMLNRSRFYGSQGRLKGIVNMNEISQYSVENTATLSSLLNLIHHEIGHHWAASISFLNLDSSRNWSLLTDDKFHWSRWVNWVSPLGGWGWNKIQDLSGGQALYESRLAQLGEGIVQFSPLDLYLMGLIPARHMPAMGYLLPDDPMSVSDEAIGVMQTISINDVVSAHGQVRCEL